MSPKIDNTTPATALTNIATLIGKTNEPAIEITPSYSILPGLEMLEDAQLLRHNAEQIRSGLIDILVAGIFKNGKSTLVNGLMGSKVSPTGPTPTTGVMIRLVQDQEMRVTVKRRSGEDSIINWETFERDYTVVALDQDRLRNPDGALERFADIDHIEIAYPFSNWIEGVSVVDSPGLDENHLRTELIIDYLPRSGAVILVIDAKRSFDRTEKKFISLLGLGKLQHVFFVINRFDLIEKEDQAAVKQRVEQILAPYFTDESGKLDSALLNQRVFYTNARQAESAIQGDSLDGQAYDVSGVAALRTVLIAYLRSDERHAARTRLLLPLLADILVRSRQTADVRLKLLSQPTEVVQERLREVDDRLRRLAGTTEALQSRIARAGDVIQYQVYSDLLQYLSEMKNQWEGDVKRLDFSELENVNIFTAQLSQADKVRIAGILSKQLDHYLQIMLVDWAKHLPSLMRPNLDKLLQDVNYDLNAIKIELAELSGVVANPMSSSTGEAGGRLDANWLEGLVTEDMIRRLCRPIIEGTLNDIVHKDGFQDLALTVLRNILSIVSTAKKSLQFLAQLGSEVIRAIETRREIDRWHKSPASEKINLEFADIGNEKVDALQNAVHKLLTEHLQEPFFERINELIKNRRQLIFDCVQAEFKAVSNSIQIAMKHHTEELRVAQTRLLEYRSSRNFSLEAERTRLSQIDSALHEQFAIICQAGVGYVISDEQINELARRYSTFLKKVPQIPSEITMPEVPDVPLPLSQTSATDDEKTAEAISTRLLSSITLAFNLGNTKVMPDDAVAKLSERLANLIGLGEVKERVLELMDYQVDLMRRRKQGMKTGEAPSLHMVFTGNPGTGKTTVAEIVGEIYRKIGLLKKGHVLPTNRAALVGEYIGWTERRTLAAIDRALDGVLFIDEAHQLVQVGTLNGGNTEDFGKIAVKTLLDRMERLRDRLVVIVAGYPKPMEDFLNVDPGLRRRFPPANIIHFPDYTTPELLRILEVVLHDQDFVLSTEARVEISEVIEGLYLRRDENFGNAGEMRNLAEALIRQRSRRTRSHQVPIDDPIRPEDIPDSYSKLRISKPIIHETDDSLTKIDAMIGLEGVKNSIHEFTAYAKRSQRLGERLKPGNMHMIFRGAPGTGKTTVAFHFAQILCSLGYLPTPKLTIAKRSDFTGQWIGHTETNTQKILESALDGVLFIDEAYSLYVEDSPMDFGRIVLNLLNDFMELHRDRLVVIIAGYTDSIDLMLDANVGLRSRFALKIDFADYTEPELLQIARKMAADDQYTLSEEVQTQMGYYLNRLRLNEGEYFGNARSVRELLNAMKKKQALRLERAGVADDAAFRQMAYMFDVSDLPSPPELKTRETKIILAHGDSATVTPLRIDMEPHAADRSR